MDLVLGEHLEIGMEIGTMMPGRRNHIIGFFGESDDSAGTLMRIPE